MFPRQNFHCQQPFRKERGRCFQRTRPMTRVRRKYFSTGLVLPNLSSLLWLVLTRKHLLVLQRRPFLSLLPSRCAYLRPTSYFAYSVLWFTSQAMNGAWDGKTGMRRSPTSGRISLRDLDLNLQPTKGRLIYGSS